MVMMLLLLLLLLLTIGLVASYDLFSETLFLSYCVRGRFGKRPHNTLSCCVRGRFMRGPPNTLSFSNAANISAAADWEAWLGKKKRTEVPSLVLNLFLDPLLSFFFFSSFPVSLSRSLSLVGFKTVHVSSDLRQAP